MKLKIIFSAFILTLALGSVFSTERIYGGYPVDISEVPYIASLSFYKGESNYVCRGSILRKNLILTAGHCVKDTDKNKIFDIDRYEVSVGSSYRDGTVHKVKNIYPHPKYKGGGPYRFFHDIAIVELVDNVVLNKNVQLVTIARKSDWPEEGTDGVVTGWGNNPEHPHDPHLYQVHLKVITAEECQSDDKLDQHEICAQTPGKNFCSGDSGGPFIDTSTNRQIGVVSYGSSACTNNEPSVFSRVTDNLDFIESIINKAKRNCRKNHHH